MNAEIPPIDETWMMCPLPCSRMYGNTAWVTQSAPSTFVSSWSRISSSLTSSIIPKCP